jgi:hypothetical protein
LAYLGIAVLALGLKYVSQTGKEPEGGRRFFDRRSSRGERASRFDSRQGRPAHHGRGSGR